MNTIEITESELVSLGIIRDIRQTQRKRQQDVADAADIDRHTLSNIENNKSGTTWANALVILQRLGCRVTIECPELNRVYVVKERE